MVVGGDGPRYVRLRPRASLAAILTSAPIKRFLDAKVNGLVSKVTFETLNLRPNMLVNVPRRDHVSWGGDWSLAHCNDSSIDGGRTQARGDASLAGAPDDRGDADMACPHAP